MTWTFHEHERFPGFGWIEPIMSPGGHLLDRAIGEHILNGLVDVGLVKESPNGCFQRARIISKPERSAEKDSAENANTDNSQSQTSRVIGMPADQSKEKIIIDPIEKIGQLAMQCREIMDAVQRLASNIETVAIEVQENFSSRDAEVQKLKQLQQLLKSLG